MDKIFEKLGLYDILVRLATGLIVVYAAQAAGITGNLGLDTLPLIIAGYFVGIILEEATFLIQKIFGRGDGGEYIEERKKALIRAGKEDLIEEPLRHAVMSGGLAIAFGMFALLHIVNLVFFRGIIVGPSSILMIVILILLTALFIYRYGHYMKRRTELIKRYYDAFCKDA